LWYRWCLGGVDDVGGVDCVYCVDGVYAGVVLSEAEMTMAI
jgi:hypothetical protein